MKGILIDPFKRSLEVVDFDGSLKDLYRLLNCNCFERVQISHTHHIYVDESGLLTSPTHFFKHPYYPNWIAGKGLILGTTQEMTNYGSEEEPDMVEEDTWGDVEPEQMGPAYKVLFGGNQPHEMETH